MHVTDLTLRHTVKFLKIDCFFTKAENFLLLLK